MGRSSVSSTAGLVVHLQPWWWYLGWEVERKQGSINARSGDWVSLAIKGGQVVRKKLGRISKTSPRNLAQGRAL